MQKYCLSVFKVEINYKVLIKPLKNNLQTIINKKEITLIWTIEDFWSENILNGFIYFSGLSKTGGIV